MTILHHSYYPPMISLTDVLFQVDDILAIKREHSEHIKPLLCVLWYVVVPHHLEEVGPQNTQIIKLAACREKVGHM